MFSLKDSEFVSSYTLKDYKNVNVSWLKTVVILYLVLHQVGEKLLHTFTFFLNFFFFVMSYSLSCRLRPIRIIFICTPYYNNTRRGYKIRFV